MSVAIDIIIPTYKDLLRTLGCVRRISAECSDFDRAEIRVVDNEGDPRLKDELGNLAAKYLIETKPGSYAARNTGLKNSSATVVAFTDSDCLPRRDWISRALITLSIHQADIAVGPVEIFPVKAAKPSGWEVIDMVFAFPIKQRAEEDGWGVTANLVTWRRCFEQVGHFDESLSSGGDAAWCKKAVSKGCKIIYDPELVVFHPARASREEHFRKIRRVTSSLVARARSERSTYPLIKEAAMAFVPPFNKWRRIWQRGDISNNGRISAVFYILLTKWYYAWRIICSYMNNGKSHR